MIGGGALDAAAQCVRLGQAAQDAEHPALGRQQVLSVRGKLLLVLPDAYHAVRARVLVHDAHPNELGVRVYADAVRADDLHVHGLGLAGSLHGNPPGIETMSLRWRASVLKCGSPLPLSHAGDLRQRQGTAALQNLAEFLRFTEKGIG